MQRDLRTTPWRRVIIGIALALVGAGAMVFMKHHRSAQTPGNSPVILGAGQKPATSTVASATSVAEGSLFPRGLRQDYELHETSAVTTTTGQPITQLEFRGSLKLIGLQELPTRIVRGEFSGTVSVSTGNRAASNHDGGLSDGAHRPFFLEFSKEGLFQNARGDPRVPPFVARAWTSLGEYLQGSFRATTSKWEAREGDATGTYLAAYEKASPYVFTRTKLRYEHLNPSGLSSYDVKSSVSKFSLDEGGRLQSFELHESTRANTGNGPFPSFDGSTELSLGRTGTAPQSAQIQEYLAAAHQATSLQEHKPLQDDEQREQARIAGLSLADIFDRLPAFEKVDAKDSERAGKAFVALTARLRTDPNALPAVRARLKKKDPLTDTLLAALRDASTPATQELLAEMADPKSPLESEHRMQAARALSLVATPTEQTVETLKTLRADREVGVQATYGLGTALDRLRGRDPVLAEQVRATLSQQLQSAPTETERASVLTAFGNAGDPSSVELIRKYMEDPSANIRAAAAQAARRIPGPESDALLSKACGDPDLQVRFSAVDAIGERASSQVLAAALSPLALREPEFAVRARAVNILARWLPDLPETSQTLSMVAQSDPHTDLRAVANNALTRAH